MTSSGTSTTRDATGRFCSQSITFAPRITGQGGACRVTGAVGVAGFAGGVCPPADLIGSQEDCRAAFADLGMSAGSEVVVPGDSGIPGACSTRQSPDQRLHWNTQAGAGTGRDDLTPVCRRGPGLALGTGRVAARECGEDVGAADWSLLGV